MLFNISKGEYLDYWFSSDYHSRTGTLNGVWNVIKDERRWRIMSVYHHFNNISIISCRAHQTRRSGRLLCLGFNEIAQFLSKSESFSRTVSLFKSVFFSPIIILFLQYSHKRSSHFLEMWPIQGLMFNILFQTR